MTIAILVPTRGRPEQFKRMVKSAAGTATDKDNYFIFSFIANDDHSYDSLGINENWEDQGLRTRTWSGTCCSTVSTWNNLSEIAHLESVEGVLGRPNNLFMLGADDTIFSTPGWDKALLDHYNNLEDKIHVYALKDSRDPAGTPHPIVTREYIDAMGYFLPPVFLHWYVDTWTVQIAKSAGCFTHLTDYELIHDKPSDKGKADETHNHIRRMGWRERDKYVNDTCQHFLEFEKQRLGVIVGKNHMNKVISRAAIDAGEI